MTETLRENGFFDNRKEREYMKKRIAMLLAMLLIVAMLLPGTLAWADSGEKTDIADAKSAVVRIYAEQRDGKGQLTGIWTGSGFGIGTEDEEPQYFITNAHVCHDDEGNLAEKIYVLLDNKAVYLQYYTDGTVVDVNDARVVACEVIYIEESEYPDFAILKAVKPVTGRTTLPLHRSCADVKDGSEVYALGFPRSADLNQRGNSEYLSGEINDVMLTKGIISKKTTSEALGGTDVIVHTAKINGGNSGGPLVDETGAAIGINTYSNSDADNNVAIYIDYVIPVLESRGIPFVDADATKKGGVEMDTRNIILIAVMAAVVLLAVALVLIFRKKGNDYVKEQKHQEASQLRIQGVAGYFNGRRFEIPTRMSFGRAPDNSMRYPEKTPGVSGHHCELIRGDNNRVFLKDVGSSNGTSINGGNPIPANQMVEIRVGDRFFLGSESEAFLLCYKGGKLTPD